MTPEELSEQLAKDPTFLALSQEEQKGVILNLLQREAVESGEQPYSTTPPPTTRRYDATTASDLASTALEVAGAAAGGHFAAQGVGKVLQALPHPVPKAFGTALQVAGAIAGAGAGAGTVAAGRAALHQATGTPDKPVGEAARDAAVEGAIGELTGQGLVGVVRTVPKLIAGRKAVSPDVVSEATQRGVHLTPAAIAEEATPAAIEGRLRKSLVAGNQFVELDKQNLAALQKWAEDLAESRFGGIQDPRVGGEEIQRLLRAESIPHYQETTRRLFAKLSAYPKISSTSSADILKQLDKLDEQVSTELAPKTKGLINAARKFAGAQNPVTGAWVPRSMSFLEAHDLRSAMLRVGRMDGEVLVGPVARSAYILADSVYKAMEEAARRGGEKGVQAWRRVDQYVRLNHQIFDDAAVAATLRARPEDVVDATLSKRSVTEIERIMSALKRSSDPQKAISLYRQTAIGRLLERAAPDGKFDPNKLYNAVYGGNGIGRDAMVAAFGKEYMKEFDLMLAAAKKAQVVSTRSLAGNPSETARSMITWIEGSAVLELGRTTLSDAFKGELSDYTTNYAGIVGTYALTFRGLSNMITSRRGVEVLRKAMLTSPRSQEAVKLLPRIVAAISGEYITSE